MAPQQWYYRKGTARFGPVSSADIKKMATEGKLEPTDLLRGVGMTEWVAASKIKGLFPKTESVLSPKTEIKPKVDNELGLAPLEPIKPDKSETVLTAKPLSKTPTAKLATNKPAAKPVEKPVAVSTSVPKSPPSKPAPLSATPAGQTAKSQAPAFPKIPQPLTASDASNPFAPFGLEQTPSNDPFAFGTSGFGNLDNLVALEKQGQTIYREPTVTAEPNPFDKKKETKPAPTSDWVSDLGPAGPILVLLMPFMCMLVLGYICGAIYGLRMYVMGFIAYIFSMFFIFCMTSGVTKISGLFAGNCLLKLKIQNEVLALGYGGLLGIFSLYVFMAGHIWMTININPFRGMNDKVEVREMDEDGRSLVLRPDEPTPFGDPDFVPPAAEETVAETEEEEVELTDEEKKEKAAILAEDPEPRDWEKEEMDDIKKTLDILDKFENGISIFASFSPFYVFLSFLPFGILLWPVNAFILILGTAHATWTSNLGYDPTKGGM
jgi:hypothetical protein